MADREYVLGTYDEEVERLGLQHRVWRHRATECWRKAGFRVGQHLLDIGAGPGYATLDLAEIVGPAGSVTALELSDRFVGIGRERAAVRGLGHVDYRTFDLVNDQAPKRDLDGAWCRWVMSFVSDPLAALKTVAQMLRPGAVFALHEYLVYSTWTFLPPRPHQSRFAELTMKNWSGAGGDPDIGLRLPALLDEAGFDVVDSTPILFTIRPQDYAWQWPLAWIASSSSRLVASGDMTASEADALAQEFETAAAAPGSLMLSPSVIELITIKR